MSESSAKQLEEVNSDQHWVETLFPPRFTFQDLLKDREEEPGIISAGCRSSTLPCERAESRRQLYISTLRQIQQAEEMTRRKSLEKRISKEDEKPTDRLTPQCTSRPQDSPGKVDSKCSGRTSVRERSIWNEEDITMLRAALAEIERDRWRLREQLRTCEEQLKWEKEKRKQLQELLEQREGQLDLSRKEAARRALEVRVLRTDAQKTNAQLQRLCKERQKAAEEVERLRVELRNAKD